MNHEMSAFQKKLKENIKELINQNRLDQAKVLLTQYENIISDDVDVYSIKGVIAILEGNMDEAEQISVEGLSINDQDFDLLYNLAFIYQTNGKKELAIEYYKKALVNAKNKNDADEVCKILKELGVKEEENESKLISYNKKSIKKILYLGWLGKGNVGDELLFELFKTMFYKYNRYDNVVNIDAYSVIPNYRVDVSDYDLIVLGGGSLIHLPFYLKICEEGLKHGVRVVTWGTGIDGMFRPEHLNLVKLSVQTIERFKTIYEKFDYISVRGSFTKNTLINSGLKKPIHEVGDPALAYVTEMFGNQLSVENNIKNRNILINWGTSYNNIFGKNELAVEDELVVVIRQLISKGYTVTVYPIWTEDIDSVKRLTQKVDNKSCKAITEVYEAKILQKLISQSFMTINLKLHANILSVAVNRPFISLAYRGKCFEFAETVNCSEYALATDQVTSKKIMKLVKSIENNYENVVQRFIAAKNKYYPRLVDSIYTISEILNKQYKQFSNVVRNMNYDETLQQKCLKFLDYINSEGKLRDYNSLLKIEKEFLNVESNVHNSEYLTTLCLVINSYVEGKIPESVFSFYLQKQFNIQKTVIDRVSECLNLLRNKTSDKNGFSKIANYCPKVSVIITTFNRKDFLRQAINSILAQDYSNIEIIVIDDCSTDGTDLMMEEYKNESSIIYMRNKINSGPGNNRRKAFKAYADGDYIMFLDDDDYLVDTNYITKAINFHSIHPEISFVAANAFIEYLSTNQLKVSSLNLNKITRKYEYFMSFGKKEYPKPVSTLTAVFKRASLIEMGILDMKMVNDSSIYLRALLVGDAGFIDQVVGVYRVHGENMTFNLSGDFIIENLEEKLQIKNIAINQYGYDKKIMNKWMDYNAYTTALYFLSNSTKDSEEVKKIFSWLKRNCPNIIDKLKKIYIGHNSILA